MRRKKNEELWAIDNSAYGAASITYEKFRDWWRAYPPGLMVLNWDRRIGGAIGLWPLSDRTAARLTNAQLKESDLTGEMMRPFREAQAATHEQHHPPTPSQPARHWYVSGNCAAPGTRRHARHSRSAWRTGSPTGSTPPRSHSLSNF
jgi:hypothetical protein